jgi:hypothetical protein
MSADEGIAWLKARNLPGWEFSRGEDGYTARNLRTGQEVGPSACEEIVAFRIRELRQSTSADPHSLPSVREALARLGRGC